MNIKKTLCFIVIACLIWNLSLSAEGLSVKLRGKLALAGILSGVAYLTHILVKRDRQAAENLQFQLGPPDRIIQFERGFDQWDVHRYREHAYFYLNNRFIRKKTHKVFFLNSESPFSVTYKPFSANPRWLLFYPLHRPLTHQPAASYLHLLEAEHLPEPEQ